MKSVALVVVALGLLAVMATPSLAHEHCGGGYCAPVYHHHHESCYGGFRPVVIYRAPAYAPVYATVEAPILPPVVAPVYAPVVPSPYYYRGPGVAVGVRF